MAVPKGIEAGMPRNAKTENDAEGSSLRAECPGGGRHGPSGGGVRRRIWALVGGAFPASVSAAIPEVEHPNLAIPSIDP